MTVYTLGIWRARAGCEQEFAAAWQELAAQTKRDFPDGSAVLLRDRATPSLFVSAGPWESVEQVERWRASTGFLRGIERIRPLVDDFQPHTMDPVATIDR